MNREDIIRMAMKAGFAYNPKTDRIVAVDGFTEVGVTAGIERFAALVAAHEREACAKVCEPQSAHDDPLTAWKIAEAIRSRGEVQP